MMIPWLTLLIVAPLIAAVSILLIPNRSRLGQRIVALKWSALLLGLTVACAYQMDFSEATLQLIERQDWLPIWQIQYYLGIDGLSWPLMALSAFLTLIVVLATWHHNIPQYRRFISAFFALQGIMNGIFVAQDAILFYIFWEAVLIPMFLLIGLFGGNDRIYATLKFFLYTFLGSVLLLVAILYLGHQAHELGYQAPFALTTWGQMPLPISAQAVLGLAMLIAFGVKMPIWPLHTWLPDAHVQAPTAASMILAGMMLKLGGYGLFRWMLPIVPDAMRQYDWLLISLSLIAIVYIGLVALAQKDMKKLIAYSSIAHMGFVTLGIAVIFRVMNHAIEPQWASLGLEGAYFQMISHGLISAALFLCVGILYERHHTKRIEDYQGIAQVWPRFAAFFVVLALANAGLPGTSGFVGEFMVIMGSMQANIWIGAVAAITLLLGAGYSLWLVKRVLFGPMKTADAVHWAPCYWSEYMALGLLTGGIMILGVYPNALLEIIHAPTQLLLEQVSMPKW